MKQDSKEKKKEGNLFTIILIAMILASPIIVLISNNKGYDDHTIIVKDEMVKVTKVTSEVKGKAFLTNIFTTDRKITVYGDIKSFQKNGFAKYQIKRTPSGKSQKTFICNMIEQCFMVDRVKKYHGDQQ